jgi:hypothetical protein
MKSLKRKLQRKSNTRNIRQEIPSAFTVTSSTDYHDEDSSIETEKLSVNSLRKLVREYRRGTPSPRQLSPSSQTPTETRISPQRSQIMEAMADRVERLATEEPGMRAIKWLTKKKAKEPGVERETVEVKLIWDPQVKGIPVFNGERQAEMIDTIAERSYFITK